MVELMATQDYRFIATAQVTIAPLQFLIVFLEL